MRDDSRLDRQSVRVTTPYFLELRFEQWTAINPAATSAPHSLIPLNLHPWNTFTWSVSYCNFKFFTNSPKVNSHLQLVIKFTLFPSKHDQYCWFEILDFFFNSHIFYFMAKYSFSISLRDTMSSGVIKLNWLHDWLKRE